MAFIPVYHVASLFDSAQARDPYKRHISTLTASTDNLDLTLTTLSARNQATDYIFYLSSTAAVNVTGIVAPTGTALDGLPRYIYNYGNFNITLVDQSGSSVAANRFSGTPSGTSKVLAPGQYAVILYDVAATTWTVGFAVPQNAFKLQIPASTTAGVIVMLSKPFWSCKNTGNYDATGTKTANAVDVFYRYGTTIPVATYASSNANEIASIPISSGLDEIIQVPRNNPSIYFLSTNATGGPTLAFRINEQGNGMNKQQ